MVSLNAITVRRTPVPAEPAAAYTGRVAHRGMTFRFRGATAAEARDRCAEGVRTFESEAGAWKSARGGKAKSAKGSARS